MPHPPQDSPLKDRDATGHFLRYLSERYDHACLGHACSKINFKCYLAKQGIGKGCVFYECPRSLLDSYPLKFNALFYRNSVYTTMVTGRFDVGGLQSYFECCQLYKPHKNFGVGQL